jgi:hypothetical protein
MLQDFVPNVSAVFPDVYCKCVYLDIAYVSHMWCKYFIWILRMFYMVFKCFSGVFASVSDAYFKCFICLQTYVASVASGCFRTKSGVTSPTSLSYCLASVSPPPPDASSSFLSRCWWRLGRHRSHMSAGNDAAKQIACMGVRTPRPSRHPGARKPIIFKFTITIRW